MACELLTLKIDSQDYLRCSCIGPLSALDFAHCTSLNSTCILYKSDAAADMQCVDLGGRRLIAVYQDDGEYVNL